MFHCYILLSAFFFDLHLFIALASSSFILHASLDVQPFKWIRSVSEQEHSLLLPLVLLLLASCTRLHLDYKTLWDEKKAASKYRADREKTNKQQQHGRTELTKNRLAGSSD